MHSSILQRLFCRPALTLTLLANGLALASLFGQDQSARFSGRITSGDGDPIPSAVIVLCNADANLWFMTSTDSAGAFGFSELPANEFSVAVLSPQWRRPTGNPARNQIWGYGPWSDLIVLRSRQTLERNIQMGSLALQHATKTSPPCSQNRPFVALGMDGLARLLLQQAPVVYTQATETTAGDQVKLEAWMSKDGRVISLRLLAPSWPPEVDPHLTRAVVESVRNWRYSAPQLLNHQFEGSDFSGQIVVNVAHDR